jgi:hypothetical protein
MRRSVCEREPPSLFISHLTHRETRSARATHAYYQSTTSIEYVVLSTPWCSGNAAPSAT